jgi:hypothetical protein
MTALLGSQCGFVPAAAASAAVSRSQCDCSWTRANSARTEAFHLSGLQMSGLGLTHAGARPACLRSRLLCWYATLRLNATWSRANSTGSGGSSRPFTFQRSVPVYLQERWVLTWSLVRRRMPPICRGLSPNTANPATLGNALALTTRKTNPVTIRCRDLKLIPPLTRHSPSQTQESITNLHALGTSAVKDRSYQVRNLTKCFRLWRRSRDRKNLARVYEA